MGELAAEREAARRAVSGLRLAPVLFELGARPHPPRTLYRAYLEQSHVFVGIYWERYGWVAPGERVSGLEDEYDLSEGRPRLIYIKEPSPGREDRLKELLGRIREDDEVSYKRFLSPEELEELLQSDLALLLGERFEMAGRLRERPGEALGPAGELRVTGAPAAPNSLVGRAQELDFLEGLLLGEQVRLVTLTGPGGIGKTRLAFALLERLQGRFPDGEIFAALAGARDSASVVATLLQACGVTEVADATPFASLAAGLSQRRMLLVADNFEQVLEAASELAALLAAAPGLKVLVTSRAALRIRGEQEVPVPPLPLPAGGRPEEAAASPAVRLFADRAREVQPSFALTPQTLPSVTEICRRLDGLPLAIELAAARVRLLPPAALLSRLDRRLAFLTGGPRDLPDRQRTLRATVDWSYDLLSPQEKLLFDRLAVFTGGFGLEAAEEVCNERGDVDLLEGLGGLLEQSLLVRLESEEADPRFSQLEVIREYADERLRERGEEEVLKDRHARYFLRLAQAAEPELTGSQQVAWQTVLMREHDNLRQALAWLDRLEDSEGLGRLAGSLGRHWLVHGEYSEGSDWLSRALRSPSSLSPQTRAKALYSAGVLGAVRRDPRAREFLEQSLALHRNTGDLRLQASALNVLGILADEAREHDQARTLYQESLQLFRRLGDLGGLGAVLLNLAWVDIYQGDLDHARDLAAEALELARERGDVNRLVASLLDLGWVALYAGNLDEAAAKFEESLDPAVQLDDRLALADILDGLGRVAAGRRHDLRAVRLLAAAESLRRLLGTPLSPDDLERFEQAVAEVKARLSESDFGASWQEGEAATPDEALREGLDEAKERAGRLPR